jgi:hypothetical protein
MEEKRCSKCGIIKPLSEYYIRKDNKLGHTAQCKQCVQAGNKENRFKIISTNTDERINEIRGSTYIKQGNYPLTSPLGRCLNAF